MEKYIRIGIQYMNNLTELGNENIFKTCVNFWTFLIHYLKKQYHQHRGNQQETLKLQRICQNFSKTVQILIIKMPKPSEILIRIGEDGIPVQEKMENLDNTYLYNQMKDIFVHFSAFYWDQIEFIINDMMQ